MTQTTKTPSDALATIRLAVSEFTAMGSALKDAPTVEMINIALAKADQALAQLAKNRAALGTYPEWQQNDANVRAKKEHLKTKLKEIEAAAQANIAKSFRQKIADIRDKQLDHVANLILGVLDSGDFPHPFLSGAPGLGKTGGMATAAIKRGWLFETESGSETKTSADLVGVRMSAGVVIEGVISRAFRRAQQENRVVLIGLDEWPRFPQKAQDVLMQGLVPIPPATAKLMGIETDEPIYMVSEALWGVVWCPCRLIKWVLGGNPWGAAMDAAMADRIEVINLTFPGEMQNLFEPGIRDTIKASWEGARPGNRMGVSLPISIRACEAANGPDDKKIIVRYIDRLRLIYGDGPADAFMTIARGFRALPE